MRKTKKNEAQQFRQGDVLVTVTGGSQPDNLTTVAPDSRGRIVLAEGEQTGHAHTIAAGLVGFAGVAADGDLHLGLTGTAALTHDEHDTITLPAGRAIVRRQREYSPAAIRQVAD